MKNIQTILSDFFDGNKTIEETIINLEQRSNEINDELKFYRDFKDEYFEQIAELKNNYPDGYNGYIFEVRNGATRFSYNNISEWQEINNQLKECEAKYKQVFLSIQKGIMVADSDGQELELPKVNYGKPSVIIKKTRNG